jgi:hypothetical protein
MKKVQPIEGFKVMDWIRDIREKGYELYKKDPQEYAKSIEKAGKRLQARIRRAKRAEK